MRSFLEFITSKNLCLPLNLNVKETELKMQDMRKTKIVLIIIVLSINNSWCVKIDYGSRMINNQLKLIFGRL